MKENESPLNSSEIKRRSQRIFENLLLSSWIFRSQEDQEDYGVDGEIEVTTKQDKATGFIFKVQLKGTSVAEYDENGQLVFSKASVGRFSYYVDKLHIPFVFVVCDIKSECCYWIPVQGNRTIENALKAAVAKNQTHFTIKLPRKKLLERSDECAEEVMEAVEMASNTITLRRLQQVSAESVRGNILGGADGPEEEQRYRLFAGVAATQVIRDMLKAEDFERAAKKARSILDSETEVPAFRILSGVNLAQAYGVIIARNKPANAAFETAKVKYGVALKMREVSFIQGCDSRIRKYVSFFARSARMNINARVAMALSVSERTQEQQGETLAGPLTKIQRISLSNRVSHDFLRLQKAMIDLAEKGLFSVMPYAWVEWVEGIAPFVHSLWVLDRSDMANAYIRSVGEIMPFCIDIVRHWVEGEDIRDILFSIGIRYISLANASDSQSMVGLLDEFLAALMGDPVFDCVDEVKQDLRKQVAHITESSGSERLSMEDLRKYYAAQAAALGVDLDDPDDRIAEVVRIGLEDLDPTRVARTCRDIHVFPTSRGMPAEMLGLPTAGSKRIVCLKHGHALDGLKLDTVYEMFSKRFPWDGNKICCVDCPDKAPHPEGWTWSYEWDAQQAKKYKELIEAKKQTSESEGAS